VALAESNTLSTTVTTALWTPPTVSAGRIEASLIGRTDSTSGRLARRLDGVDRQRTIGPSAAV